jgi:YVTN family beta-propeller protein
MTVHEPGSEIAGYRIESVIGRGGMAVVYRAEDLRLRRKVALKLLTPHLADSEQFRQRFILESRLAASLDHPNIVPIYEAGEADGQLFIAMRYVLGSDLKGLLAKQSGPLAEGRLLRLFAQIGDALDAAHRAGLVHRDVKPANILVVAGQGPPHAHGDPVYLTDFGLTKRTSELSSGLTGTGHFLGTVDYVSPEQIQGKPVGPGTDIYALGCVLYECLTGQLPFRRDDDAALLWAHLVDMPPPVTGIRPEVGPAVNAVVARAMAKDPADRYQTCRELVGELEQALDVPEPGTSGVGRHALGSRQIDAGAVAEDSAGTEDSREIEGSPELEAGRAAGALPGGAPGGSPASYSLAIDMGTSFVAAAVADDRGLEMFSLGDGSVVEPAAVYVRDDSRVLTGEAAARRAVSHPERFAREIKRNLANPTPIMLGGAPYAVSDLLGAQLEDVLDRVTERQGAKPEVVALTHPANWGPFRRELFTDVARSAGLTDPLYTTEPEAAAAHDASTRPLGEGDVLAVYDLGGGTFDATVLRRTAQGFEIVGTPEGIERLGGADFDEAIFAHVNYLAGGALGELDLSDSRTVVALARLRQDCTLAKEALSVDAEATIPVFLPNRHFEVTLTRAELEGMIRAPIESTIGTLDRVLRAAQVDRTMLAAVLLVGGSSRIPLVAQMVSEAFGRPTVVGAHPKHAVALGAALLAEARRTNAPPAAAAAADSGPSAGATIIDDRTTVGAAPAAAVSPQVGARGADEHPSRTATVSGGESRHGAIAAAPPQEVSEGVLTSVPGLVPPDQQGAGDRADGRRQEPARGGPGGPEDRPPGGGRGGEPPGPPARPRPSRRRLLIAAAAALVLILGVTLGVVLWPDGSGGPTAGGPAAGASPSSGGDGAGEPATAPSAPPQVAVPVPSVGGTIPVGVTPGFVAVTPNGHHLYVANRTAGVVTVVDTAVNQVTATIKIDAGPPQYIAFSPDGRRAYVSVWNDERTIAAVSVLDTTTNKVVDTIPVQTRPCLSAVSPDGKWIYVPNHDTNNVSVIDTATDKLVTNFNVAPNPHWVAFSRDGSRAYTANHDSNVVSVIDTATNTVLTTIPTPKSPHSIAVHPTRPLLIVATYDANSASVIDTDTNTVVATIAVGKFPPHAAWAADGRFADSTNNQDNSVSVIDASNWTVTARIPTGASPTSMAVLPDGSRGYVSNLADGTLTVLNLAG